MALFDTVALTKRVAVQKDISQDITAFARRKKVSAPLARFLLVRRFEFVRDVVTKPEHGPRPEKTEHIAATGLKKWNEISTPGRLFAAKRIKNTPVITQIDPRLSFELVGPALRRGAMPAFLSIFGLRLRTNNAGIQLQCFHDRQPPAHRTAPL